MSRGRYRLDRVQAELKTERGGRWNSAFPSRLAAVSCSRCDPDSLHRPAHQAPAHQALDSALASLYRLSIYRRAN